MINDFVIDSMHLFYLVIMKRLLREYWTETGSPTKLSNSNMKKLSERLKYLSTKILVEFQRTTRSLENLAYWKATEYRMLLLYFGPMILQDILDPELYAHFLLYHLASRIIS